MPTFDSGRGAEVSGKDLQRVAESGRSDVQRVLKVLWMIQVKG